MKKSLLARLFSKKAQVESSDKHQTTPEDIRKKLETYRPTEGPASFGNAGVYSVSEETSVKQAQSEDDSVKEN